MSRAVQIPIDLVPWSRFSTLIPKSRAVQISMSRAVQIPMSRAVQIPLSRAVQGFGKLVRNRWQYSQNRQKYGQSRKNCRHHNWLLQPFNGLSARMCFILRLCLAWLWRQVRCLQWGNLIIWLHQMCYLQWGNLVMRLRLVEDWGPNAWSVESASAIYIYRARMILLARTLGSTHSNIKWPTVLVDPIHIQWSGQICLSAVMCLQQGACSYTTRAPNFLHLVQVGG